MHLTTARIRESRRRRNAAILLLAQALRPHRRTRAPEEGGRGRRRDARPPGSTEWNYPAARTGQLTRPPTTVWRGKRCPALANGCRGRACAPPLAGVARWRIGDPRPTWNPGPAEGTAGPHAPRSKPMVRIQQKANLHLPFPAANTSPAQVECARNPATDHHWGPHARAGRSHVPGPCKWMDEVGRAPANTYWDPWADHSLSHGKTWVRPLPTTRGCPVTVGTKSVAVTSWPPPCWPHSL